MTEAEAKLLLRSGVIDKACLFRQRSAPGTQWEIHLYGEELPPTMRNPLKLTDGSTRLWPGLEAAHTWLTGLLGGRKLTVEVDG